MAEHVEIRKPGNGQEPLFTADYPGVVQNSGGTTDTLIGAVNETPPATDTASSGLNGRMARVAQNISSFLGTKAAGTAAAVSALVGAVYTAAGITLTTGQQAALQSNVRGELKMDIASLGGTAIASTNPFGVAEKGIAATFSTCTRPANQTPYVTNDSISDNATAGSVTALVATVSDTNDAPVTITSIEVATTDTGLGTGISIRAYLFNSDPTASSGVGAGDNVTYSQKQAGLVGTFSGVFHANSDGGKAFLAPEDTGPTVYFPASGAKTFWIQYQVLAGFTPSANSTTLIGKAKGYQLRA